MQAVIYKPARNVMQAGLGNTKQWALEIKNSANVTLNNLVKVPSQVGGSSIKLFFETLDLATEFAKANNITYSVINTANKVMVHKQYQDNITKNRNNYYF